MTGIGLRKIVMLVSAAVTGGPAGGGSLEVRYIVTNQTVVSAELGVN